MALTPTLIDKQYQQIWGFDPRTIPTCNLWIDTSQNITDLSIYGNKIDEAGTGTVTYSSSPNGLKYINVSSRYYLTTNSVSASIDHTSVKVTGVSNLVADTPLTYITVATIPSSTEYVTNNFVNVCGINSYGQTGGVYPRYLMNTIPTSLVSATLSTDAFSDSTITTTTPNSLLDTTPIYFTKSTSILHSVGLGKVISNSDNTTTYYVKTTTTYPNTPTYWGYYPNLYITISGYTDPATNGVFQITSVSDISITVNSSTSNQVADSSTGTVKQVQLYTDPITSTLYAKYILTVDPTNLGYIADGFMSINISGMSAVNTITSSSTGTLYLITDTNVEGISPYYVSVAKTIQVDMSNIVITKVDTTTISGITYARYYTANTSMCVVGQLLTVTGFGTALNNISNVSIQYISTNNYIRVASSGQSTETKTVTGSVTGSGSISQFSPGTGVAKDTGIEANKTYYIYGTPPTNTTFTISLDGLNQYTMLTQQFPSSTSVIASNITAASNIIATTTRIVGSTIYVNNIDWLQRGDRIWFATSSSASITVKDKIAYYINNITKTPSSFKDYGIQIGTTLGINITFGTSTSYISNIYFYNVSIGITSASVAIVGMIQIDDNVVQVKLSGSTTLDTTLSKMVTISGITANPSDAAPISSFSVPSGYNGTYQILSTPGTSDNKFNIQTTLNGGPILTSGKVQTGFDITTNDFAIFAVVNILNNSLQHGLLEKNGSTLPYWSLYVDTTNKVVFNYTNSTGSSKAIASSSVSGWHIISVIASRSGNTTIYIDGFGNTNIGTSAGNATTLSSVGKTYIGRDQTTFWNSGIGEILAYNTTFSSTMQQTIEGYLSWKWGLQGSLVSTHPYSGLTYTGTSPPSLGFNPTSPFARLLAPTDIPNCNIWLDSSDKRSIYTNKLSISLTTSSTGLATATGTITGIAVGDTIVVLKTNNTSFDGVVFTVNGGDLTSNITFQTNVNNQGTLTGSIAYSNYDEYGYTTSKNVCAWVDRSNNKNTASYFYKGSTNARIPTYTYNSTPPGVLFSLSSSTSNSLSQSAALVSNFSAGNRYETGFIVFNAIKFSNKTEVNTYFTNLIASDTYVWNSSGIFNRTSSTQPSNTRVVILFQHATTYQTDTVFSTITTRKWNNKDTSGNIINQIYSASVNSGNPNAGLLHTGNTYILVYKTQYTTGELIHRINGLGVPATTTASFGTGGSTTAKTLIGPMFQGKILEYIAYVGTSTTDMISNTDIQRVEGYLANKWNIPLTSGHPFYTIPPDKSVPY